MSFYIYLLSSLIFTNLLFIIFYKSIANKINLFDHPNLKRKIHKTKIFLGGGILFVLILPAVLTSLGVFDSEIA
jgi:UDP-N-acetylmuramyl pentapeptide phosphotransferase/UDP-N-acetylglucosamine-1-phosphate transferase